MNLFLKMTLTVTSKIIDLYLESPCIIHSGLQASVDEFRRPSSKSETDNEMDVKKSVVWL